MPLRWLRCISLQLELAAVAVKISITQMLHLSHVKVSVTVAAGADDHIILLCFKCW